MTIEKMRAIINGFVLSFFLFNKVNANKGAMRSALKRDEREAQEQKGKYAQGKFV